MQDQSFFGSDSATWHIGSEAIVNIGGGRALLMQLAHPLVAAGVSQHSRHMSDPFGRAMSTFMLGQMLAFGSIKTTHKAARIINRLHACVIGKLPAPAGDYAANTIYSARDPDLLLWVHATIVDTVLVLYQMLIGTPSWQEQDAYYQESKRVARLLGLSASHMPESIDDLRQYIYTMVHSNRLSATPQARQLARQVLFPPSPTAWRPLMYVNLYITTALLPPPIRQMYDLGWGPKRQLSFKLLTTGLKPIIAHLPPTLRLLPVTRRLMLQGKVA